MQYGEILITFEGSTTYIIFFVLMIPITGRALLYVMVHSFAHSSFWRQQQEAGEHDYGAFMERYWQRKTELLGENPVRVLLCPPKIPLYIGHVEFVCYLNHRMLIKYHIIQT